MKTKDLGILESKQKRYTIVRKSLQMRIEKPRIKRIQVSKNPNKNDTESFKNLKSKNLESRDRRIWVKEYYE